MKDLEVLKDIWNIQKEFNEKLVPIDNLSLQERQEMTKEYTIHLISEVYSILETVNWKMHHKSSKKLNKQDTFIEIVDAWKYLLSIGLLWGLTPEEFVDIFTAKSQLVSQKYRQEYFNLSKEKKVLICDIDGVLNNYPECFISYVEECSKQDGLGSFIDKVDMSSIPTLDIYDYLSEQINPDYVRECKYKYRTQGLSLREKVNQESVSFLQQMKSEGFSIILLTSRPLDAYKCLEVDTYRWLVSNNIPFDFLISDSKKRNKVLEVLRSSKVDMIIDDDPKIMDNLKCTENQCQLYLLNRSYNRHYKAEGNIIRVNSLFDIKEKINED